MFLYFKCNIIMNSINIKHNKRFFIFIIHSPDTQTLTSQYTFIFESFIKDHYYTIYQNKRQFFHHIILYYTKN